jgi:hypothetical protein
MNSDSSPVIVLQLGPDLRAVVDGQAMGPAPNERTAALAMLIGQRFGDRLPRRALARQIHPSSEVTDPMAALRQTLLRLRNWLGRNALEADAKSIAARGSWIIEAAVRDNEIPASAYRHPVFDSYRTPLSRIGLPSVLQQFDDAVRAVASVDRTEARGMLVGAPGVIRSFPPQAMLDLLDVSRPRRPSEAFAFEHSELVCWALSAAGLLDEAEEVMRHALATAKRLNRPVQVARAQALLLFIALETGNLRQADQLLNAIAGDFGHHRLLVDNAMIAYAWNTGRLDQALSMARERSTTIRRETVTDRIHFWSNLAVLAAEAEDVQAALQAAATGESLLPEGLHAQARWNLRLARLRVLAESDPQHSVEGLAAAVRDLHEQGRWLQEAYAREALAVALCKSGDRQGAEHEWRVAEEARMSRGWRLNPRHLRIRSQLA